MGKICKLNASEYAGFDIMFSLAFFLLLSLFACRKAPQSASIYVQNGKATEIWVPSALLTNVPDSDRESKMSVHLLGHSAEVLGDFIDERNKIRFRPVIALTPGMDYTIMQGVFLIGKVHVPGLSGLKAPKIVAIYPQLDTLPENLLKFYIHFSEPMQSGVSLSHIHLLNEGQDTLKRIFLDLQPELWDSTGHILTIWLNPGRIKRDLVLNRSLGNPLLQGHRYQLEISANWKDSRGIKLNRAGVKGFYVARSDTKIPYLANWTLQLPAAGTKAPLTIDPGEALDHYLFQEAITITDEMGKAVSGKFLLRNQDKTLLFLPDAVWRTQNYTLGVSAILEDLSGNNMNRLFDRDLKKDKKGSNEFYYRNFSIRR